MPDTTFETLLSGQLREYAEAGVRPIDRFAIAEETIAIGRTKPRWRRGWGLAPMRGNRALIPLLVGLLLAALVGGALLVGARLLAPPPLPHSYVNELVSAADLSTPRWQPALVTLEDGRVLIMGDSEDGSSLPQSAEIYDPATGGSVRTGPMVSAADLVISAAVRLHEGRVLVIGDARPADAAAFAVAQIFDPKTMRFAAVGPMVTPRAGARLERLPDGRVLMLGGTPPTEINTGVATAEIFDPVTLTFTATGPMGDHMEGATTTTLPDGRVFVIGGNPPNAEIYDPTTGTFAAAGGTPGRTSLAPGVNGLMVTLADGRIVVFGSEGMSPRYPRAEVWDPIGRTFSPLGVHVPGPVDSATMLDDGRIFLTGRSGPAASWSAVYDPTTRVTTLAKSLKAWWPTVTRLSDGRVLVVGGLTDGNIRPAGGGTLGPAVATVEIFR